MTITIAQRLADMNSRGLLHRTATVGAIDVEARTVELAFSSETDTVERWFGIEILGHAAGECDLSRLNNGAPVLWMHNPRDQRGVIESARIDGDRIGRAVVRFSRSAEGEQLFQDIVDGIVTKVSVGYNVQGALLVEERGDTPVYRITAWQPNEISLVSIPADDTVGVGRSLEKPQEESAAGSAEEGTRPNRADPNMPNTGNRTTMEKNVRDAQGNLVRAKVDENGNILEVLAVLEEAGANVRAATAAGSAAERARVTEILQLGREYGAEDKAADFIKNEKTADDFRRLLLADFAIERSNANKPLRDDGVTPILGLTDKEVQRYSFMNAVRALANPNDAKLREAAAFEFEVSATAQRQYGKEAKGILIPADVLGSSRAFNAGGAANSPAGAQSGANLVETNLLTGSFIETLRNRTTIMQLGRVLGGLVGNVDIPKQTGGAQAYWLGEGDNTQETGITLGQIGLSPKTVGAFTDITRRLSMQSSQDVEALLIGDLNAAMAQAIDRAGYVGTGSDNMPRGLKNYTGINGVDFATAGQPTYKELVAMETEIAADNADVAAMAYVGNARFRGHCKTTPKFGTGTESVIWEQGGTVNGYRTEITNQVDNGDVFFGNWSDFLIALWGGLDLIVDPYTLSQSGGLRLVVFQDVDFVARRLESFCWGSDQVS